MAMEIVKKRDLWHLRNNFTGWKYFIRSPLTMQSEVFGCVRGCSPYTPDFQRAQLVFSGTVAWGCRLQPMSWPLGECGCELQPFSGAVPTSACYEGILCVRHPHSWVIFLYKQVWSGGGRSITTWYESRQQSCGLSHDRKWKSSWHFSRQLN